MSRSSSASADWYAVLAASIALQLVEGVAKLFASTGGGEVEGGGVAEVADGGFEVAAALIRFAAAQPRQHGVGPKRDGAAVGLDGGKRSGRSAARRRRGRAAPGNRGRE